MKNILKNFLSGINPWDLFALKLKTLSGNKNSIKTYIPGSFSLANLFFYSVLPILWIWVSFRWIIKQDRIPKFLSNRLTFWIMKQFAVIKNRLKKVLKDALCFETILSITVLVSGFFILRKVDYRKGFISLSVEKYVPALNLPSQNLSWQTLEHIVAKQKYDKLNLSNFSVIGNSSDKNKLLLSIPDVASKKSDILDKNITLKNTTDYNTIDQIDVFRDSIWIHFSSNWNKEQQQSFIGLYPDKIQQKTTKSIQQEATNEILENFCLKLQKRKKKQYSEKFFIQHHETPSGSFKPYGFHKQKFNVPGIYKLSNKFRLLTNSSFFSKNKKILTNQSILTEKQVFNWSQIYARDWMGLFPEVKPKIKKNIFNSPDNVFQLKDWLQTWYSSLDEFPTKLSENYNSTKKDNFLNLSGLVEILENNIKNGHNSISKRINSEMIEKKKVSFEKTLPVQHTVNLNRPKDSFYKLEVSTLASRTSWWKKMLRRFDFFGFFNGPIKKNEPVSKNDLSSQKIYNKYSHETKLNLEEKDRFFLNGSNKNLVDLSNPVLTSAVEKLNIPKSQLKNLLSFDNKKTRLNFYKKYYFLQNELNNLQLKNKFLPSLEWFATNQTKNSKKFDKLLSELKPRSMSGYLYPDMERKQIESRYLQSLYRRGFHNFFWVSDFDKSNNQQSVSKLGIDFPVKTNLSSSFLSEFALKFGNFIVPKLNTTPKLHTIRKKTVFLGFDKIVYDAYGIVTDSITKDIKISNSKSISNWAFDSFGIENPMSNRKSDSQVKSFIKHLIVNNYSKNQLATFKGYRHNFDSTLTLLKQKINSQPQSENFFEIFTNKLSDELYQDVSKLKSKSTSSKKPDVSLRQNSKELKFINLREKDTKKTPDEYKIDKLVPQLKKENIDWRVLPYEETKKIAYLPSKIWIKFIKKNQPVVNNFIEHVSKLPSNGVLTSDKLFQRLFPFVSVPETPSGVSSRKKENAEKKLGSKTTSTLKTNKLIFDTPNSLPNSKIKNEKEKTKGLSKSKKFWSAPGSDFNFIEWPLTSLDRQPFPWSFIDSHRNSRLFLESASINSKILPKINVHYFPYSQNLSTPAALELTSVSGMYQRFWTQYEYQSRNLFEKIFEKAETSSWIQKLPWISFNGKPNQTKISDYWEPLSKYSWMASTKLVCLVILRKLVRYLYITYVKEALSAFLALLLAAGLLDDDFIEQLGLTNTQNQFRVFKKLETRFQNIAGIDNLLPELGDVVWFFRNGGRTFRAGKTIPKGILLVGPPGTGKTFLVQAIAGEGEVPVLVQSGSSFFDLKSKKKAGEQLEILFEKARELAPCLLFIDEIDSVGGARQNIMGHPMGADGIVESIIETNKNLEADSHYLGILPPKPILETRFGTTQNWNSQGETIFSPQKQPDSLNKRMALIAEGQKSKKQQMGLLMQFLVEMDGLKPRKGVVVVGATNRPASLDPALLRPGRFNQIIHLELPRKQKRIEILKLYSQNLGIQKPLSWDYFANLTNGWSAAELASAMNESSMHAIIQETVHTVETMERGIEIMSNLITQTGKQWYGNSQDPFRVTRRAFYQAGKALVSSILVEHPLLVVLHLWPRPTNSRQNRRLSTAPQINRQTIRRPLEIRIIGFYAGKASELLVLGGNNLAPLNSRGNLKTTPSTITTLRASGYNSEQESLSIRNLQKQKNENYLLQKNQIAELDTVTNIVPVSPVSNFYKTKRFIFLFKGLAYLKIIGEKKDLKSIQYLLNLKKKNQFGQSIQTNFSENHLKKIVIKSARNPLTLWHSDLGTDDLSSASSLASLMIEKWFFYSKTIAGRKINTILSDHNSKHFREEQRLQAITQLADENDDIEVLERISFSSYQRDQEWYLPAWWQMRTGQEIQKVTKIYDEWFRIYISDPVQKLRNIEWIPGEIYFHKNQALKNCLPKSVNVSLPFNNLYNFDREYIYHGLLMNSFHKAFLLLDQNRELLDYFADTLICSEILRENEIISIVSTFGYSVNKNKILLTKSK